MIKKAIRLLAVTAFVMTVSCKKENATANKGFAVMDFVERKHDFGEINAGDKVQTVFVFTNKGDTDLLITKATGSCGCTVPDYSKTPVKPGQKGEIKVSFNSNGKKGKVHKTVGVEVNTKKGVEVLDIQASIKEQSGIIGK